MGISGMAVANEDGMIGAVGWTSTGRGMVAGEGLGIAGGCEKFVDPGPGS